MMCLAGQRGERKCGGSRLLCNENERNEISGGILEVDGLLKKGRGIMLRSRKFVIYW